VEIMQDQERKGKGKQETVLYSEKTSKYVKLV